MKSLAIALHEAINRVACSSTATSLQNNLYFAIRKDGLSEVTQEKLEYWACEAPYENFNSMHTFEGKANIISFIPTFYNVGHFRKRHTSEIISEVRLVRGVSFRVDAATLFRGSLVNGKKGVAILDYTAKTAYKNEERRFETFCKRNKLTVGGTTQLNKFELSAMHDVCVITDIMSQIVNDFKVITGNGSVYDHPLLTSLAKYRRVVVEYNPGAGNDYFLGSNIWTALADNLRHTLEALSVFMTTLKNYLIEAAGDSMTEEEVHDWKQYFSNAIRKVNEFIFTDLSK